MVTGRAAGGRQQGGRLDAVVRAGDPSSGDRVRGVVGIGEEAQGGTMTEYHDWEDIRAELHDGDEAALAAERARTEAWVSAFHLAEERKRLGLTQRQVADLM